jgi:uncharacterized protein
MAISSLDVHFVEAFKFRRSYYALQKASTLNDDQIEKLITELIIASPTSFNCQNTRVVLLLRSEHDFLWNNIVSNALKPYVSGNAQAEAHTSARLASFVNSHGTILFFNDPSASAPISANTPAYSNQVPQWDEQSGGMLQVAIWVALEAEGMGCNLQHYNPIIVGWISSTYHNMSDNLLIRICFRIER